MTPKRRTWILASLALPAALLAQDPGHPGFDPYDPTTDPRWLRAQADQAREAPPAPEAPDPAALGFDPGDPTTDPRWLRARAADPAPPPAEETWEEELPVEERVVEVAAAPPVPAAPSGPPGAPAAPPPGLPDDSGAHLEGAGLGVRSPVTVNVHTPVNVNVGAPAPGVSPPTVEVARAAAPSPVPAAPRAIDQAAAPRTPAPAARLVSRRWVAGGLGQPAPRLPASVAFRTTRSGVMVTPLAAAPTYW